MLDLTPERILSCRITLPVSPCTDRGLQSVKGRLAQEVIYKVLAVTSSFKTRFRRRLPAAGGEGWLPTVGCVELAGWGVGSWGLWRSLRNRLAKSCGRMPASRRQPSERQPFTDDSVRGSAIVVVGGVGLVDRIFDGSRIATFRRSTPQTQQSRCGQRRDCSRRGVRRFWTAIHPGSAGWGSNAL